MLLKNGKRNKMKNEWPTQEDIKTFRNQIQRVKAGRDSLLEAVENLLPLGFSVSEIENACNTDYDSENDFTTSEI